MSQLDSTIAELSRGVVTTPPTDPSGTPEQRSPATTGDGSPSPGRLVRDPLRNQSQDGGGDGSATAPHELSREDFPRPEGEGEGRACGVVLSRAGYYTIPSLGEMDGLVEGRSCVVVGFGVGRRDFGKVEFPGPTDVFGLNLDALGEWAGLRGVLYVLVGGAVVGRFM